MKNRNIQPGTVIRYNHPHGGTALDRVIRIEGENCIISVPTIGGTWVLRAIPISEVISSTVHHKAVPTDC